MCVANMAPLPMFLLLLLTVVANFYIKFLKKSGKMLRRFLFSEFTKNALVNMVECQWFWGNVCFLRFCPHIVTFPVLRHFYLMPTFENLTIDLFY